MKRIVLLCNVGVGACGATLLIVWIGSVVLAQGIHNVRLDGTDEAFLWIGAVVLGFGSLTVALSAVALWGALRLKT